MMSSISRCGLHFTRRFVSSYNNQPPIEPEPGLCCDEGCESCVWLVYANELLDFYKQKYPDSLERVKAEIEKKVESPTVKGFVLSELSIAAKRFEEMSKMNRKTKK